MVAQPEQQARETIDKLLAQAGWLVCDPARANIRAARGVAIREFPLKSGHGFADYLLYVDGKAAGVIEAKKEGATLTGVEIQSAKYTQGLPDGLPCWRNPLPFSYQSTGVETRFTNGLDPAPRSRPVFSFHRPETLAELIEVGRATPADAVAEAAATYNKPPFPLGEGRGEGGAFLARLQHMPALKEAGLWPAQIKAIHNLEQSLKENRPRALIQMGERRVKEPRTPAQGCAGRTTSAAGLRGEVTGSVKILDESKFDLPVKGDSAWE